MKSKPLFLLGFTLHFFMLLFFIPPKNTFPSPKHEHILAKDRAAVDTNIKMSTAPFDCFYNLLRTIPAVYAGAVDVDAFALNPYEYALEGVL